MAPARRVAGRAVSCTSSACRPRRGANGRVAEEFLGGCTNVWQALKVPRSHAQRLLRLGDGRCGLARRSRSSTPRRGWSPIWCAAGGVAAGAEAGRGLESILIARTMGPRDLLPLMSRSTGRFRPDDEAAITVFAARCCCAFRARVDCGGRRGHPRALVDRPRPRRPEPDRSAHCRPPSVRCHRLAPRAAMTPAAAGAARAAAVRRGRGALVEVMLLRGFLEIDNVLTFASIASWRPDAARGSSPAMLSSRWRCRRGAADRAAYRGAAARRASRQAAPPRRSVTFRAGCFRHGPPGALPGGVARPAGSRRTPRPASDAADVHRLRARLARPAAVRGSPPLRRPSRWRSRSPPSGCWPSASSGSAVMPRRSAATISTACSGWSRRARTAPSGRCASGTNRCSSNGGARACTCCAAASSSKASRPSSARCSRPGWSSIFVGARQRGRAARCCWCTGR